MNNKIDVEDGRETDEMVTSRNIAQPFSLPSQSHSKFTLWIIAAEMRAENMGVSDVIYSCHMNPFYTACFVAYCKSTTVPRHGVDMRVYVRASAFEQMARKQSLHCFYPKAIFY